MTLIVFCPTSPLPFQTHSSEYITQFTGLCHCVKSGPTSSRSITDTDPSPHVMDGQLIVGGTHWSNKTTIPQEKTLLLNFYAFIIGLNEPERETNHSLDCAY